MNSRKFFLVICCMAFLFSTSCISKQRSGTSPSVIISNNTSQPLIVEWYVDMTPSSNHQPFIVKNFQEIDAHVQNKKANMGVTFFTESKNGYRHPTIGNKIIIVVYNMKDPRSVVAQTTKVLHLESKDNQKDDLYITISDTNELYVNFQRNADATH